LVQSGHVPVALKMAADRVAVTLDDEQSESYASLDFCEPIAHRAWELFAELGIDAPVVTEGSHHLNEVKFLGKTYAVDFWGRVYDEHGEPVPDEGGCVGYLCAIKMPPEIRLRPPNIGSNPEEPSGKILGYHCTSEKNVDSILKNGFESIPYMVDDGSFFDEHFYSCLGMLSVPEEKKGELEELYSHKRKKATEEMSRLWHDEYGHGAVIWISHSSPATEFGEACLSVSGLPKGSVEIASDGVYGSAYWCPVSPIPAQNFKRHPNVGSNQRRNRRGVAMTTVNPRTYYHVTTEKNAKKIATKGIIPLQPSNWVRAVDRKRYGKGEIFAFDNQIDAMRWGSRMDWEFNKEMGSGKIVIVEFTDDAGWEVDDADPLGQAGKKGNWLKRFGSVDPKQIVSITPVTLEHVRRAVAGNPAPSRFWGRAGAGILFFCPEDQTYLLTIRSQEVEQPGTVGIPGGACKGEGFYSEEEGRQVGQAEAWVCATREVTEELGWFPHEKKIVGEVLFEKGNFTYRTFIVEVPLAEKAISQKTMQVNWENDDARWYGVGAIWKAWPVLHFGTQHIFREIYGMDANTPPSGV